MAYDANLKMSISDINGNYYMATQNGYGNGWTVITVSTLPQGYIKTLPNNWDQTAITWERDTTYKGIFRSMSSDSTYSFSKDARAIIQYIYKTQGLQGYGLFTLYLWNENTFSYDIFYTSQLDFTEYHDYLQTEQLEIETLDSGLIRDIRAYGDTQYNIPIWEADGSNWTTDAEFVVHDGIKLLYQANYINTATPDNLYQPNPQGFNLGRTGTDANKGVHTIPSMAQYSITQNNGTTTFIGNDILNNIILQGSQNPGAEFTINEVVFSGTNQSQPYTRNNNSIKNALPTANGYITMNIAVSGTIAGTVNYANTGNNPFIAFVLFEIGPNDICTTDNFPNTLPGHYSYIPILNIDLPSDNTGVWTPPNNGNFSNYNTPSTFKLKDGYVYIFGIILDNPTGIPAAGFNPGQASFALSALQFSIFSLYDYGASGVPIPAPMYNPSVFPAFRLYQLLETLVPYLATIQTNPNGFPLPISTPFTGKSTFLSNPSQAAVGDVVPYQILWTSAYCIHDLEGQSFITASLNQLFSFCNKILGCGASIEYDNNGNPNIFRIENLSYFFDNTTMILDLGFDVVDFEITVLNESLGANLKLGYTAADLNSDFGTDSFNTELYFDTPLSNMPGVMDFEDDDILTELYAIEKLRAQQTSQPIGSNYNPANPSSDNQNVVFYCQPSPTVALPSSSGTIYAAYGIEPYDPNNNPYPCNAYQLTQRTGVTPPGGSGPYSPAAQNNDPTAASAPYINGFYYPDTAFNVELSPCRALLRDTGKWIHSVLDNMDADYLAFRNTYVMQYNNIFLGLAGIATNLELGGSGTVITEFSDKLIGNLPAQLFKPIVFKVTSKYPVNMYQIINDNPRGYVRWFWNNKGYGYKEYHGFIFKVTQAAGNNQPTQFYMWATPDTVL